MSTKAIREALALMKEIRGYSSADVHARAVAELEAIERAAKETTRDGVLSTHVLCLLNSIAEDAE